MPEPNHTASVSEYHSIRKQIHVRCRNCQTVNRLFQFKITDPIRQPRCGSCQSALWTSTEPISGLHGDMYQHALDREALQAIHAIPGVETFLKKIVSESFERASRMYHFSSFLHCGTKQAPQLYELFRDVAHRLDIRDVPDLFLLHQDEWTAYTSGVKQPLVAISSGLVEELDEDELMVVFAHELGHWQCQHVLYKMASRLLSQSASSMLAGTLGLGSLAIVPLRLALLKWERCAELTADRASLLAVREPRVVLRTMMKLAGGSSYLAPQLSMDAFLEQIEHVRGLEQEHVLNRLFSVVQELFQTHPVPVWRTAEWIKWTESEAYFTLLAEHAHPQSKSTSERSETSKESHPLMQHVRGVGQHVVQDVRDALFQGSSKLKQWFGDTQFPPSNKSSSKS